jgi:hypothetical protein
MTGGNYWMPAVIQYQDAQGELVFGGGLSPEEIAGLDAGALRARHNLDNAASIEVTTAPPYRLRITNLTGHKLISGYPEGRRMWINVKWYNALPTPTLLREDGAYGPLEDELGNPVEVVNPADGQPVQVQSILDLEDTRIYEVHMALTQEWAAQLLGLGYPASLPVGYDRYTGAVEHTLGDVGAEPPGSYEESFHFVLNNKVVSDNRIPTYRMRYDMALVRNVLPEPLEQYGNPGPGGEYQHWDDVVLNPPPGAVRADVSLLYQPTSWEYIQFLDLANDGSVTFLGAEGTNMLEAWIETGMAAPHTMAATVVELPEPAGLATLAAGAGLLSLLARRRARTRFADARAGS